MVHSAEDGSIPVLDMSALIALLEAAEAGSRELDAAVWAASNGYELFEHDGAGWRYRMKPDDIMRHERTGYISPYTTSIDAALALAERVLPGWRKFVEVVGDGRGSACVFLAHEAIDRPWFHAPTPALALCISILRAIQHGYEAAGVVSPNLKAKAQGEGG